MAKYYNVIIVSEIPGIGNQFLKYHNIAPARLKRFWQFAEKIPGLHHVNFYEKGKPKGKNFVKQVRAEEIRNGTAYVS
jgi:hypothetical protein